MAKDLYVEINSDGSVARQSIAGAIDNPSSTRVGNGKYTVEFKPGFFTKDPYALATVMPVNNQCGKQGTNRTISLTEISRQRVCVGIRKAADADKSSDRRFILHVFEP